MPRYYVNNTPQANGDHEVHANGCYWLQQARSVSDLGEHATCVTAVRAAKQVYATANGCASCSPACHTR